MTLPSKTVERKLFSTGYQTIIAVDEVGMGCLAGPVVVCAVRFDKKFFAKRYTLLSGVRDSKLLSSHQREVLVKTLVKIRDLKFKISYCYPKTIDRVNIYQAARLAMRRAVVKLQTTNYKLRTVVLVDGPTKISGLNLEQIPITRGDRKVFAIACASIIAKVHRDRMMVRYAKKFPGYGFEKHKGYGTKYHQAQLSVYGASPIHRQSFAPVAKLG